EGPREMFRYFFVHEDARVYFGMSGGKLLNVPLGLVRNLFPVVPEFYGIRGLLAGPRVQLVMLLSLCTFVAAFLLYCGVETTKRWSNIGRAGRLGLLAGVVGLLVTMFPVVTWNPHYDKLWIQPFACLALLTAISLKAITPDARASYVASRVMAVLLLVGATMNL